METIGRLERYEGHLLNWYDIQTLAPLEPRYVSTVDSGNLLGALWSLEQGLEELLRGPVLDGKAFAGLRDTGEILNQVGAAEGLASPEARAFEELMQRRGRLRRLASRTPSPAAAGGGKCQDPVRGSPGVRAEGKRFIGPAQLEQQVPAWRNIADRYLAWVEILAEKKEEELAPLGPEALRAIRRTLSQAPSLLDLARGSIDCIPILQSIRDETPPAVGPLAEWIDRLLTGLCQLAMAGR